MSEAQAAGWAGDVELDVFEGPDEYLYGEETALLEVLDGRPPFPRIAPPYRRGYDEVVEDDAAAASGSGLAADVEMAGPGGGSMAPPALVDNVETLANVPGIIAKGAGWFREEGTEKSPGTIVATVTGAVRHDGVGEVTMGTTVAEVIEQIGGGARPGRQIVGVLGGASSTLLPADRFHTALTYEAMAEAGSGLGSASLIVLDDADDLAAAAAGVARFLAVESCGQCTPCKQDGLEIADRLASICGDRARRRTSRSSWPGLAPWPTVPATTWPARHRRLLAASSSSAPTRYSPTSIPTPSRSRRCLSPNSTISPTAGQCCSNGPLPASPTGPTTRSGPGKSPVDRLGDHRAEPEGEW